MLRALRQWTHRAQVFWKSVKLQNSKFDQKLWRKLNRFVFEKSSAFFAEVLSPLFLNFIWIFYYLILFCFWKSLDNQKSQNFKNSTDVSMMVFIIEKVAWIPHCKKKRKTRRYPSWIHVWVLQRSWALLLPSVSLGIRLFWVYFSKDKKLY